MFSNGFGSTRTKNRFNSMFSSTSSSSTTTTTQKTPSSSSSSSAAANSQTQSLIKAYFKTPESRYKLSSEKTQPPNLLPYSYAKSISQVTLAQLKDKPNSHQQPTLTPSYSTTGVRSAAARLLGGNDSKALSFVGGSGYSSKTIAEFWGFWRLIAFGFWGFSFMYNFEDVCIEYPAFVLFEQRRKRPTIISGLFDDTVREGGDLECAKMLEFRGSKIAKAWPPPPPLTVVQISNSSSSSSSTRARLL